MYDHPAVQRFLEKLVQMESSALEAMLSSPPEEMISARERVKVIRALLAEQKELLRERQATERSLAELLVEE